MNPEILRIIDSIAHDRGIDRELLIHDLEQAMVSAARRHYNSLDTEEFECRMDPVSGEMTLWRRILPDEPDGEAQRVEIDIRELGRIPAQTAKQVMMQKFREDERNSLLETYSKLQGALVTGTSQRYEGGALVVQLDRGEGFMPRREQIPGEQFHAGDRVRCVILDVREAGSQVKIVLSRADQTFIRKMFEAEVPEVAEKIIEIKAMAREPGARTKIAVSSVDSKVDPVGACVGVRGSRIRNIVDELGGEKIDIVRWNESSQVLIANALKPAEVEQVSLCFELGRGTVIVREDQLSLAIGKRGQNVRLAANLTGWDLDILTPEEFGRGLEILEETLKEIEGVTPELLDRLAAMGMISVFDIEEVGVQVLTEELEVEEAVADRMVEICQVKAAEIAEQQKREKEEQERLRAEQEAAGAAILGAPGPGGDASAADTDAAKRAADILGGGGPAAPAADGDEPAADDSDAAPPDEGSDAAADEGGDAAADEAGDDDAKKSDEPATGAPAPEGSVTEPTPGSTAP